MNRPLLVAAFSFLLSAAPLLAQHGGGHASGGGMSSHGGGFSGHSGFSGGGHSGFSGSHSFSGARSGSSFGARSYNRGSSLYSRGYGYNRYGTLHTYGFRNRGWGWGGYGYGYGYPYYGGLIDPYWWFDPGTSYDPDQQYQNGLANEMNQQSLEEQQMRQQADASQDPYVRSAPTPPHHQARSSQPTESIQPTVLVFRDQHRQEVQNYAIVGQTLWNFAPGQTQKIPLSNLDLPATTKANDDRGISFRVPGANEGQ
jgi:hypothetical protein